LVSSVYPFGIFGVNRRYQRDKQKIPKGKTEDTKGVNRRYQRGKQKIPKR
jgi:hypothetical protein